MRATGVKRSSRSVPRTGASLLAGSSGGFRLARFGRGFHLVEPSAPHVVDVAVDRHICRNERMFADASHILYDARLLVLDRVPLDEMAGRVAAFVMGIRPALSIKRSRAEIVIEQIGDDIVGK